MFAVKGLVLCSITVKIVGILNFLDTMIPMASLTALEQTTKWPTLLLRTTAKIITHPLQLHQHPPRPIWLNRVTTETGITMTCDLLSHQQITKLV